MFKAGAVEVVKVADGDGTSPAPTNTASAPVGHVAGPSTAGGEPAMVQSA